MAIVSTLPGAKTVDSIEMKHLSQTSLIQC